MGCDIHVHVEVKIGGEWLHYNAPDVDRHYGVFGVMAGVRGDDTLMIAPPRGLPDDCSTITRIAARKLGADGHSHSWFGLDDIKRFSEWWRETMPYGPRYFWLELQFGFLFGNSYAGFLDYRDDYPAEIEGVRFVFWFDN